MKFMTYNPEIHHRHSIRLKDFDYSRVGAYFITICAWQRECLFGEIVNGVMMHNDMGGIVLEEWQRTGEIRENIILDECMVMPNHFHGIIFITDNVGATPTARPAVIGNDAECCQANPQILTPHQNGPVAGSIGAMLAQFKAMVTKRINVIRNNPGCPAWQRNYYERIIRNDYELCCDREYIINNPIKWELDNENPANHL